MAYTTEIKDRWVFCRITGQQVLHFCFDTPDEAQEFHAQLDKASAVCVQNPDTKENFGSGRAHAEPPDERA